MTTKFDQDIITRCQDWYERGQIKKNGQMIMYLNLFDSLSERERKSLWKGYVSMEEYTNFLIAMQQKDV